MSRRSVPRTAARAPGIDQLAALADELSERRRKILAAGRMRRDSFMVDGEVGLSFDSSAGMVTIEGMAVEAMQEAVLMVLADGGFADKRTQTQAWEQALVAARTMRRQLDAAHAELVRLGQPRGVLGLVGC